METKTLAFDARDVEGFKEFFPEFKSGNMTGRELGSRLLEMLKNQFMNSENPSIQANEDEFEQLRHDYEELLGYSKQLEKQLAETTEAPLNSDFQRETQDSINVKNELQEEIQSLKVDNQRLNEKFLDTQRQKETLKTQILDIQSQKETLKTQILDIQSQKETLKTQVHDIQSQKETLETRLRDLKAQLKDATNRQDAYAFTPYFKQLIEVMTAKINDISKTAYSTTDVIMQSLFATYFNSHTSIRYTYPMSKGELLALAQQYYPELRNEKELFNLMIHKIKEEDA